MGPLKAGDDDVPYGGGTFGHRLHQVFCRKARVFSSLRESSFLLCGMGLRNRIQIVGFTPAGAQLSGMYLVYAPLFLMWC